MFFYVEFWHVGVCHFWPVSRRREDVPIILITDTEGIKFLRPVSWVHDMVPGISGLGMVVLGKKSESGFCRNPSSFWRKQRTFVGNVASRRLMEPENHEHQIEFARLLD